MSREVQANAEGRESREVEAGGNDAARERAKGEKATKSPGVKALEAATKKANAATKKANDATERLEAATAATAAANP